MTHRAGAGHPGGSLSEIDILVALYSTRLRYDSEQPDLADRDRFIHPCTVEVIILDGRDLAHGTVDTHEERGVYERAAVMHETGAAAGSHGDHLLAVFPWGNQRIGIVRGRLEANANGAVLNGINRFLQLPRVDVEQVEMGLAIDQIERQDVRVDKVIENTGVHR